MQHITLRPPSAGLNRSAMNARVKTCILDAALSDLRKERLAMLVKPTSEWDFSRLYEIEGEITHLMDLTDPTTHGH